MKEKKHLTPEEIYKRNQKRAKTTKILAPICFWVFISLAILCIILAIKNSFGNVSEIIDLLDSKKYTGQQIEVNYANLIEKYGEWIIGSGDGGFLITFINIGKALFSGFMITNFILSIVFFISAYVLGKWFLPKLSEQITADNQDMVNITILKNNKE